MSLRLLKNRLEGDVLIPSDELLEDYLESARCAILARRYPFEEWDDYDVPRRYVDLQVRIALEMISKRGAEGQTNHTEDGVSRSYASAGVSEALLSEVLPRVGTGNASS